MSTNQRIPMGVSYSARSRRIEGESVLDYIDDVGIPDAPDYAANAALRIANDVGLTHREWIFGLASTYNNVVREFESLAYIDTGAQVTTIPERLGRLVLDYRNVFSPVPFRVTEQDILVGAELLDRLTASGSTRLVVPDPYSGYNQVRPFQYTITTYLRGDETSTTASSSSGPPPLID